MKLEGRFVQDFDTSLHLPTLGGSRSLMKAEDAFGDVEGCLGKQSDVVVVLIFVGSVGFDIGKSTFGFCFN